MVVDKVVSPSLLCVLQKSLQTRTAATKSDRHICSRNLDSSNCFRHFKSATHTSSKGKIGVHGGIAADSESFCDADSDNRAGGYQHPCPRIIVRTNNMCEADANTMLSTESIAIGSVIDHIVFLGCGGIIDSGPCRERRRSRASSDTAKIAWTKSP